MWCCRACFLSDQTDIIPGDGTPGAAVVGPDPDDPSVCARAGHPWHNPVHAVDGRSVRPAPQRHGVRRGGSCYLMRCAVAGCTSETCQFAHSDEELAHWRQRLPPPVDHVFHPAVRRALGALEIPVPVTDNIREKINALGLADVLRRLRAPPRRGLRGYAALLGALRGPPPPEDNEDAAGGGGAAAAPRPWLAWAWPQWDGIRDAVDRAAAVSPLTAAPPSPWAARRACGTELLECLRHPAAAVTTMDDGDGW